MAFTNHFAVRCSGCNVISLRQDPLPFTCGLCVTQPIAELKRLESVVATPYVTARCSGCNTVVLRQNLRPFTCVQCVTQPIIELDTSTGKRCGKCST